MNGLGQYVGLYWRNIGGYFGTMENEVETAI